MNLGYVWALGAVASFGLVGILCKVSEIKKCRPSAINALCCVWAAILVAVFLFVRNISYSVPAKVAWLAIAFGVVAAVSSIAFLTGIKYGKISTSWLVINLSAAVPAFASILIYEEVITASKASGLLLAVIALFMVYNDKRTNMQGGPTSSTPGGQDSSKRDTLTWFLLMGVAFLLNGSGSFGLKILAQMGITEQFQYHYLLLWFLGDLALAGTAFLLKYRLKVTQSEIWLGAGIGVFGLTGQLGIAMALSHNVPGYLVFPLAIGGSLFVVVTAGVLIFKEKVGRYGTVGMILGLAAIIVLAIP